SSVRMEPMSLNRVVADAVSLLRRTIDPRVVIEVQTAPDISPVLADSTQMHQLLLNLCLNARDAMPDGGRLTISTAPAPAGAGAGVVQRLPGGLGGWGGPARGDGWGGGGGGGNAGAVLYHQGGRQGDRARIGHGIRGGEAARRVDRLRQRAGCGDAV